MFRWLFVHNVCVCVGGWWVKRQSQHSLSPSLCHCNQFTAFITLAIRARGPCISHWRMHFTYMHILTTWPCVYILAFHDKKITKNFRATVYQFSVLWPCSRLVYLRDVMCKNAQNVTRQQCYWISWIVFSAYFVFAVTLAFIITTL